MQSHAKRVKRAQGMTLAELPICIWLIFVMMLMPMLSLATMTLKWTIMNAVISNGASSAARAKTFESPSSDGKPPAKQIGPDTIRDTIKKFPGMRVTAVNVVILQTPTTSGFTTRSSTKLAQPADTSKFIYQIESQVRGEIDPLFLITPGLLGRIPGVSIPLPVSFVAREIAENPQGLNK